jgi:hypothetical protein
MGKIKGVIRRFLDAHTPPGFVDSAPTKWFSCLQGFTREQTVWPV